MPSLKVRSVFGSPTFAELKSRPLTMLKTVVFAAIPRAIDMTTTAVNPGVFAKERKAYRRSWISVRILMRVRASPSASSE